MRDSAGAYLLVCVCGGAHDACRHANCEAVVEAKQAEAVLDGARERITSKQGRKLALADLAHDALRVQLVLDASHAVLARLADAQKIAQRAALLGRLMRRRLDAANAPELVLGWHLQQWVVEVTDNKDVMERVQQVRTQQLALADGQVSQRLADLHVLVRQRVGSVERKVDKAQSRVPHLQRDGDDRARAAHGEAAIFDFDRAELLEDARVRKDDGAALVTRRNGHERVALAQVRRQRAQPV
jgi:hypothetical protein